MCVGGNEGVWPIFLLFTHPAPAARPACTPERPRGAEGSPRLVDTGGAPRLGPSTQDCRSGRCQALGHKTGGGGGLEGEGTRGRETHRVLCSLQRRPCDTNRHFADTPIPTVLSDLHFEPGSTQNVY